MLVLGPAQMRAATLYDPALQWFTVESEHFSIHFHAGVEDQVHPVIAAAETSYRRLSEFFSWQPAGKIDVVISDRSDLSNGFATAFPSDRVTIFVTSPPAFSVINDHQGWLETLLLHELAHVLHFDKVAGLPGALRHLLGRNPFLMPNALQPAWIVEGLATYLETDWERGVGRGQNSIFDMYMRMEVARGVKSVRHVNQNPAPWPGGNTAYLYGVQFMKYLAQHFGEEQLRAWVAAYSDNIIPFAVNSTSRAVFSADLPELWQRFSAALRSRYQPQIEQIVAAGVVAGERLTQSGYLTGVPVVLNADTLLYRRDDGRQRPAIVARSRLTDVEVKIAEVENDARFDVHPQAGILVAQPELCRNASVYFDLYRIHIGSGRQHRLTTCGRYIHAVWRRDGKRIIAVQNEAGRSSIVELDHYGNTLATLWEGRPGILIQELDVSPDDQTLVVSVWRSASGWNLERFDLARRRWSPLTRDNAIELHPRFTEEGDIVFSADFDGIYNIYRWRQRDGTIEQLTRVMGGAFAPVLVDDDLYYLGYHAGGHDIFHLPAVKGLGRQRAPSVEPVPAAQKRSGGAPAPALTAVGYSPWRTLRPRWWFPFFLLDDSRREYGITTSGWDVLQRHNFSMVAGLDVENRLPLGRFAYVYDRWWPIAKVYYERENHYFVNAVGDVERIRRERSTQLELVFPTARLTRAWNVHASVLIDRQTDVLRFGAMSPVGDFQDDMLGLAVTYDSTRRYPLAFFRDRGRDVRVTLETSELLSSDFTGEVMTVDWRESWPLGDGRSVAARGVLGLSTGRPRLFEVGGPSAGAESVGALTVPTTELLFNRRRFPLRGYVRGLAPLRDRNVLLGSLEWRVPLARIERGVMAPPVGVKTLTGTVFLDAAALWGRQRSLGKVYSSVGVEGLVRLVLGYDLNISLRAGWARGLDDLGDNGFYLVLGRAF